MPPIGAIIIGIATALDGDTIRIDPYSIRLHAIDAPEARQTCTAERGTYDCGAVAAHHLASLIVGQSVRCVVRGQHFDRLVAVCSTGGRDIGGAMVEAGWALAWERYGREYVPHQERARHAKTGLWQGDFESPWAWRVRNRPPAVISR